MNSHNIPHSFFSLSLSHSLSPSLQKQLRDLLKKMDEASLEPQLVRLGDASIASPFTSRHSSIECSEPFYTCLHPHTRSVTDVHFCTYFKFVFCGVSFY